MKDTKAKKTEIQIRARHLNDDESSRGNTHMQHWWPFRGLEMQFVLPFSLVFARTRQVQMNDSDETTVRPIVDLRIPFYISAMLT